MDGRFEGVLPAVVTPFDSKDASVDYHVLRDNVDWLITSGVHGIVGIGTMGEFRSLSTEERGKLTEVIVDAAAGRVPVTIGISADTPSEAADAAEHAAHVGAAGLMSLPPVSYKADEREVVAYFAAAASATDLPLMVYNNPEGSKNDLRPDLLARLFEIDGVVAVKECSGDARRIPEILELTGHEMEVLVGGDDWALEGFSTGASGWVSGCANVAPRECVELWNHCIAGRLREAKEVYFRLLPLARLDMRPKLVQFFKAAMDQVGRYGGPTRPPRLPLTESELEEVRAAVSTLARSTGHAKDEDAGGM
jgi:4-hydroxy-tetrahydrodipicolinate synthase